MQCEYEKQSPKTEKIINENNNGDLNSVSADDCTIIVNSCDAYADLWFPFFELFRIHWPDCKFPVVLNTETKTYKHPENLWNLNKIESFRLYDKPNQVSWSQRLIETLKLVKSEFVLLFLDDDFIIDNVDNERINNCIQLMKNDSNIMCFRAIETNPSIDHVPSDKYPGFNLDGKNSFRSSVNIMLYRKSQLIKQLKPRESAWEYEGASIQRSKHWKGEYYSSQKNQQLIPYNANMFGGYGVWHGKWRYNNIKLFKDHGIDVDFSIRGILTEEDVEKIRAKEIAEAKQRKKSILRKIHFLLYKCKKAMLNGCYYVKTLFHKQYSHINKNP